MWAKLPAVSGNRFTYKSEKLVLLCHNPPSALRQAQDERLNDQISMCCPPFVVSLSNHERTSDTVVLVGVGFSMSKGNIITGVGVVALAISWYSFRPELLFIKAA